MPTFDEFMEMVKDPFFWIFMVIAVLVVVILRWVPKRQPKSSQPSATDELQEVMMTSEASLSIGRNTAIGGAAMCVLLLIGVLQLPTRDRALDVSVYAAAVGIPTLVCMAAFYEMLLSVPAPGREWLLLDQGKAVLGVPFAIGGIALVVCVGAVFAHFPGNVVYWFGIAGVIALLFMAVGRWLFARWLHKRNMQTASTGLPPPPA